MFQEHPDLIKDQFWDDLYPEIPYTAAAEETRGPDPVIGAAANIEVKYLAHIVSGMRNITYSHESYSKRTYYIRCQIGQPNSYQYTTTIWIANQ